MTALIDNEYEIPAPLLLQSWVSLAWEGSLAGVSVLDLRIVAVTVASALLLADSTDSMNLADIVLKSVWSVGYLQRQQTALATVAKSSVSDRSIQHGNGYLVESLVLTCSMHAQQPHYTYALSKHSGEYT